MGLQIAVTSDDGYIVTWDGNKLRHRSEKMYRKRHSERRTRSNAEILLDAECQESRYAPFRLNILSDPKSLSLYVSLSFSLSLSVSLSLFFFLVLLFIHLSFSVTPFPPPVSICRFRLSLSFLYFFHTLLLSASGPPIFLNLFIYLSIYLLIFTCSCRHLLIYRYMNFLVYLDYKISIHLFTYLSLYLQYISLD